MTRITIPVMVFMFFLLSGATAPAQEMTLTEAIGTALKQSEAVLIAEQSVEKARGQITSARSEALPRLSLNGFYTRNWRVPTSVINGNQLRFGSSNVLNGNITLSIPLYRGGKVSAARRVAQAFREVSEAGLTATRQQVVFDTQRAYYAVLLSEELIRVNEAALSRAEANFDQVSRLQQAGAASEYDLLRARVQISNARPGLISAKNNRDIALLELKRTIGLSLDTPLSTVGTLKEAAAQEVPVATRIEAAVDMAIKSRPEVAALDYQIEMLEDGVRVQAAEMRPSLNLVNSYQNQAQVNDLSQLNKDRFVQSYNSRLVVDIPLFDGFKSRGGVAQARADARTAGYTREQRVRQIELEARQAFMRVEEARARLQAQEETLMQAEKGMEIAEVRYRTGVATQLEVLDAQLVLTQTRTAHAQALNDYAVAVAGLRRSTGIVR